MRLSSLSFTFLPTLSGISGRPGAAPRPWTCAPATRPPLASCVQIVLMRGPAHGSERCRGVSIGRVGAGRPRDLFLHTFTARRWADPRGGWYPRHHEAPDPADPSVSAPGRGA